jgi:hypothetical protein
MNIEGMIRTRHQRAACVATTLQVDNLASMRTVHADETVTTAISSANLRSVIASVDDYLMNLTIAEELCSSGSS